MLRAVDLSFAYGHSPVLRRVGVTLDQGTLVGILGPNGSGKTTLLRLLAGVLTPTSGKVLLDETDLSTIARRRLARRIAVVPQDTHLTFDYKVLEIALMGRHPYLGPFEIEGPEDVAAARRALEATGTLGLAERSFDTLSGGERQRVVIASALTQFDEGSGQDVTGRAGGRVWRILLLDEPTASLDLHYQLEVASLLRRLKHERKLTVVVTTHDLNLAAALCEELILLRDGEVIATGPTAGVMTPANVRALYGVDADVRFHVGAGHLTVVPLAPPDASAQGGP